MKDKVKDLVELVACRTIGCTSVFARWFEWPYGKVCNPLVLRWWDDERKQVKE